MNSKLQIVFYLIKLFEAFPLTGCMWHTRVQPPLARHHQSISQHLVLLTRSSEPINKSNFVCCVAKYSFHIVKGNYLYASCVIISSILLASREHFAMHARCMWLCVCAWACVGVAELIAKHIRRLFLIMFFIS